MDLIGSRYDPELQMFADEPHELDQARLRFWRWLGEHGRLEHDVAGVPNSFRVADLFAEGRGVPCPAPDGATD